MRWMIGLAMVARVAYADGNPLEMAEEAFKQAHYPQARELSRRATSGTLAGKDAQRAWRIVGASSCFLRDRDAVLEALGHLPAPDDAEFLRFACEKSGVPIALDDVQVASSPAREVIARAETAYRAAKYGDAKKLAEQAATADPKLPKAWRLLGAAACYTKDKRTAQRACDHLQPVDQEFVRAVCARTLGALSNSRVIR